MDALELSMRIETAFRKFGYEFSVARGTISASPAESIQEGLRWLQLIGVISKGELDEHLPNYQWDTNLDLSALMSDASCAEQLDALLHNLDYWKQRNLRRNSSETSND